VLTVLFEAGAIVARARATGRPFGTRAGKPAWTPRGPAAGSDKAILAQLHHVVERLVEMQKPS
jgi:hypothetical protein